MKILSIFIFILLPLISNAQLESALNDPALRINRLFKLGSQTVTIKPMEEKSEAHRWTTFDSALNVITTKRLVTPYAKSIIRQNYLSSGNSIIRIDQYLVAKQLHISAYVFNVQGNIIKRSSLTDSISAKDRVVPSPYNVMQSSNRQVIALVQAMVVKGEGMNVSKILIDANLKLAGDRAYTFPFDPEILDMYAPMVSDEGTVLLFIADKFQSYRLGSTLSCYLLPPGTEITQNVEFNFERKKVKSLKFNLSGDKLTFSALFSRETSKKDIVGELHAGFDISSQTKFPVEEISNINEANR